MRTYILIIHDFFKVALGTWIILFSVEIAHPGMVHRILNLEYYFYFLIIVYLVYRALKNK